jgi:DNA-binding protein HU-beta
MLDFARKLFLYGLTFRDHQEVTVNKTELIERVSTDRGLPKRDVEMALDGTLEAITTAVRAKDPVRITGFGTFKLRERGARNARNPQTGATVKVKASRGIAFSPGATLKANLNSKSAPKKAAAKAPAKATKSASSSASSTRSTARKATKAPAKAARKVVSTRPALGRAAKKATATKASARKR